jgi:AraC-like DNA-binding protein
MVSNFEAKSLYCAIMGLVQACQGPALPTAIHHWVELIQSYVLNLLGSNWQDDRLRRVWAIVEQDLARPWTLAELAHEGHLSPEHLRRCCQHDLRSSPMRHLTRLRMHRAAELLATTSEKVASVARMVGYQNPFVFSTSFKRWMGWQPSAYRRGSSTILSF